MRPLQPRGWKTIRAVDHKNCERFAMPTIKPRPRALDMRSNKNKQKITLPKLKLEP